MNNSIYSVAQIQIIREDYKKNMDKHIEYIQLAAQNGAQMIVFPEMSLTGYERELAKGQCFEVNDKRLDSIQKASVEHNIIIVVGAPLLLDTKLFIASWIFSPTRSPKIYIKKFLHPGEEVYYHSRNDFDPIMTFENNKVSFAICYDIEKDEHIDCVHNKNSNLYAASIFYSINGIQSALDRLQLLSKKYLMAILMSNYVGNCWSIEAGGCSSIWSQNGEVIISADQYSECLLIAESDNQEWHGRVIKY